MCFYMTIIVPQQTVKHSHNVTFLNYIYMEYHFSCYLLLFSYLVLHLRLCQKLLHWIQPKMQEFDIEVQFTALYLKKITSLLRQRYILCARVIMDYWCKLYQTSCLKDITITFHHDRTEQRNNTTGTVYSAENAYFPEDPISLPVFSGVRVVSYLLFITVDVNVLCFILSLCLLLSFDCYCPTIHYKSWKCCLVNELFGACVLENVDVALKSCQINSSCIY